MKYFGQFIRTISLVLISGFICAQPSGITIEGSVIESQGQQPVEFATVMLVDSSSKQSLTGVTTDMSGRFKVRSESAGVHVVISFLGYTTRTVTHLQESGGRVDLGIIELSPNVEMLDEVEVRAERSQTVFQLDKRVFNVGKDLSSTGASALEVLNNVPSVNVSIEGVISLRGSSGVQILINGKPSVLADEQSNALGTITAEMIDRVEVITNPSAKYEAEGTSGIINIVIKKDEREGLNGSVSLNTGSPHNHSIGLSMNRRTEKFNLFSQLGVGYRELPSDVEVINQDLINNTVLTSEGKEFRNETFYNVILGTDYYIDVNNVITLSGSFAYEVEDQPSRTTFTFLDGPLSSAWYRDEVTEATNPKYRYELQYKRQFTDHEDHALLFSALGNFFGKDQESEFQNTPISGLVEQPSQLTRTEFQEAKYTFNLDYTKPFSEKVTLETGSQYVLQNVSNDYAVSNFEDAQWVLDPGLTNIFEYDQKVLGIYGTGAYEGNKWGIKLGLRMETTDLNTYLITTGEANEQHYTNLFPSGHMSYKWTDQFSIQTGYSRRVYRPRLWDLNPFFNIRNNFSIRTGNPDLQPEFTDSYELSGIVVADKISFNFGVYHRFTTDVIERVSVFEENVQKTTPMNLGTSRVTGLEFNTKYNPRKWLVINGDINLNAFDREGAFDGTSFDFRGDQWSTKWTAKLKLPLDIDAEITGRYNSDYETVQGTVSGNLFADLGLRAKIMDGRGVLNFSVRDVFAARVRESIIDQPEFYLYRRSQRGRFITFGFSYGFGKGEAMEFSGARRRY